MPPAAKDAGREYAQKVETTQIYVAMPDSRLRVGLDAVTLAG